MEKPFGASWLIVLSSMIFRIRDASGNLHQTGGNGIDFISHRRIAKNNHRRIDATIDENLAPRSTCSTIVPASFSIARDHPPKTRRRPGGIGLGLLRPRDFDGLAECSRRRIELSPRQSHHVSHAGVNAEKAPDPYLLAFPRSFRRVLAVQDAAIHWASLVRHRPRDQTRSTRSLRISGAISGSAVSMIPTSAIFLIDRLGATSHDFNNTTSSASTRMPR